MNNPPKYNIGDIINWYCDKEQRIHQAKVKFVNFVHVGHFYDDINYEVETMCCGEKKMLFIDEKDVMPRDFI